MDELIEEDVESLGLPSRTCFDLLVKIAAVLSDVTACAHWFICRYFSQAVIYPMMHAASCSPSRQLDSLGQRASFVINNLFAGG